MSGTFKCANCGKETNVRGGNISLICQVCGCGDITFDKDVSLRYVHAGDVYEPVVVPAGEPFFGLRTSGFIWNVSFIEKVEEPKPTVPATLKKRRGK